MKKLTPIPLTMELTSRSCARCGIRFQTRVKHYICPACRQSGKQEVRTTKLSPREQQIVTLIQEAKSNKQIAFELQLTEGTVKEYLYRIFRKMNVGSRTELALRSYRESLMPPIPDMASFPLPLERAQ
ncbi:MAG TPA: response regulator transcription factor [Bryobacteraceae bacterium]|nr:response regulator transcription factor [Bryobacteraceae bacterium]